jgi:hypothetical protein
MRSISEPAQLFCDSYKKCESLNLKGRLLENQPIETDILILLDLKRGFTHSPPYQPLVKAFKSENCNVSCVQFSCANLNSKGLKIALPISVNKCKFEINPEKQFGKQNDSELRKLIHEKSDKCLIPHIDSKTFSLYDAEKVIDCLFSDDPIGEINKLVEQGLAQWI